MNSQTPSPAFPSSNPYADAPAQPKNKKKHRLLGWVAGIAGVFIIGSALTGTGDGSSSGRDAADDKVVIIHRDGQQVLLSQEEYASYLKAHPELKD